MAATKKLLDIWDRWQGEIDCEYTGKIWKAEELKEIIANYSTRLKDAGLKKGDTVALVLANTAAFPIFLISCLSIKCNVLLLHCSTPLSEIDNCAKSIDINWICHDYIDGLSRLDNEQITTGPTFAMPQLDVKFLKVSYSNGPKTELSSHILHPTSGTYGTPLICIRDQEVAVAEAINYTSVIDIYNRCKIVITTPFNHAFAYGFGLISALLTDSTMIIAPVFNPKRLLHRERSNPADILMLVPPMLQSLSYFKEIDSSYTLPKSVFYAGTKCTDIIKEKFEKLYDSSLYTIYGTTETGGITTSYAPALQLKGVGRNLNNVSIAIKNKERYSELTEGIGEVFIRSTSMMNMYLDDNEERSFIDYYPTNDIGYIDNNEQLILVGRVKDIINVNGIKVDPAQVEKVLLEYKDVVDAVVYPGASDDGSEVVSAAICCSSSKPDLSELKEFCYKQLASYKVPVIFNILEELPRTASGKCLKVKLPGYYKSCPVQNKGK